MFKWNTSFSTIIFALFFFVDPTVFFRVIIGNDIISILFVLIFLIMILVKCLDIFKKKMLSNRYLKEYFLVILYIIISTLVHVLLGQDFNYLVQHEIVLIQCFFLFILLIEPKYQKNLLEAYFLASFIHLLTLLPFFSFLTNSLSENTSYGDGEYSIGVFSRRATGFFNSPGQLSLFAIGAFSLGLFYLKSRKNVKGTFLLINSLVLGIAALSRSFFVTCIFVLLIFIFKSSFKIKLKFTIFATVLISFLLTNETFLSYYDLISERLSTIFSSNDNDRLTGETGLYEVIKVIERYPFFGNPILIDGKALFAWNGEIAVRPHVGLLCVLCYYGFILGFPIYYLVLKSTKISFKEVFLIRHKKINGVIINENPFLFGFIAVFVVTLVEPLLEHPIFFLFLFGLMHHYKQKLDYKIDIEK